MAVADRSIPFSSTPVMICIDGLLDGSGSMHRLTTLHSTARSSLRTLLSSGSTSFPISSGCWRYLVACVRQGSGVISDSDYVFFLPMASSLPMHTENSLKTSFTYGYGASAPIVFQICGTPNPPGSLLCSPPLFLLCSFAIQFMALQKIGSWSRFP